MYTLLMRPIAVILLSTLISILTFSTPLAIHAQHMEGSVPMEHCPFMAHTDTLCPMTFAAHLAAWQSLMAHTPLSMILTLLLLSFLIVAFEKSRFVAFERALVPPEYPHLLQRRVPHEHPTSLHQLLPLFSHGILNPKLF